MIANPTLGYLSADNEAAICANWQSYKGYTVRPTRSCERLYATILERSGFPGMRLLMYGGTPELRDCISAAKATVTLVDRSPAMVYAMGLLTAQRRRLGANESVLGADWREFSLEGGAVVDGAVADDAINMVDWDDFDIFLATAHRHLKNAGFFAFHLLVQPDERYRRQPVEDVLLEYERGIIRTKYELASRINFSFYEEQTHRMGWQRSIAGLKALPNLDRYPCALDFIHHFRDCNSSFTCPPQALWEQLASRYFTIEDVFYPTEFDYCRFEPLYVLRRKNA